jgi:hypothetical protein
MNEFFDGAMSCEFAAEFSAQQFGSGSNTDAREIESVGIPAGADSWLIS